MHTNVSAAAQQVGTAVWRPCPMCKSEKFVHVLEPIARCKHCGLCFVNPLGPYRGENESEDYFLNDYLPLHEANRENSLAERRAHLEIMQRRFGLPAHPRLLDVGCALGAMLQEAKRAGWDAVGIETSGFAARYAAEHTGCPVHAGTLQQAALASDSFDVVTLMDVIEHVANPCELMNEVYRILRPGGIALVVTPNFGSFFVRLYGLKAYGVWPDQHVVYFQPSTITRLLRQVGFTKVITTTKDFYPDNLKRFFRQSEANPHKIKAAFGARGSLGRVRQFVNWVFMRVPLGDKLIAYAQK